MFAKLDDVIKTFDDLNQQLADPNIYSDNKKLREVTAKRSDLEDIVATYKEYKVCSQQLEDVKEMLKSENDAEMREMLKEDLSSNEKCLADLEEKLKILLLPQDPLDKKNVMVEIRAGAGGDEASIFVGELYRMYQNYFKDVGFKSEMVSISQGDEGIKEVIFNVNGDKVFSKLKYESGVHRVQRVPKTEAQGRVHTSTVTVAVLPEPDEIEFELDMNDVRVDVYRSGGSGGQSVNTTDSAVRVTHLPTNTVVAIQDEKSQIKNKEKALKILRSRIYDQMVREAQDKEAQARKSQVGRGDRSERIRTYNFPQGRLSDHRIGLTIYSLDKVMEGEIAPVIDALIAFNQAENLKNV